MQQQQELNQFSRLPEDFFPIPLASPTATNVGSTITETPTARTEATKHVTIEKPTPEAQWSQEQQQRDLLEHQQYRDRLYQRRPSRPRNSRVIVIAYDHSNYGDAMIAKAITLKLIRPADDIRIVHIVNQSDYRTLFAPMLATNVTAGASGAQESEADVTMSNAINVMMYEVTNALKKHGFLYVSTDILRGDPKESVADYCRITKPLYLITGTRGLGAVKRSVMGSVSSYLIRHCPCPVLVCKVHPTEIEARQQQNQRKRATIDDILASFNSNAPQLEPQ